jgi:hypothetical protein
MDYEKLLARMDALSVSLAHAASESSSTLRPPDCKASDFVRLTREETRCLYWEQSDFQDEKGGSCKSLEYLEDKNGDPVSDDVRDAVYSFVKGLWSEASQDHQAPVTWGKRTARLWTWIKDHTYTEFPFLALCARDWKLHKYCTDRYPKWWKAQKGSQEPSAIKNEVETEEKNAAGTKIKNAKRIGKRKRNDVQEDVEEFDDDSHTAINDAHDAHTGRMPSAEVHGSAAPDFFTLTSYHVEVVDPKDECDGDAPRGPSALARARYVMDADDGDADDAVQRRLHAVAASSDAEDDDDGAATLRKSRKISGT